jgi:heme/copper-type cytochrome/quinol oxidase subunit 2
MKCTRGTVGLMLVGVGALIVASPGVARLLAYPRGGSAQEQAPNRREFTVTAKDYRFSPERLEVTQDDLVKLTVRSEDVAYSLTIDEYRVSKRVPAGGATTFEFRADRAGTFAFYSNLTSDARHGQTRGELVVRGR